MGRFCLLTLVIATAATAQVGYPGQYPGTGRYPPGQYPGTGGPGIPMPGRHKKSKDASDESLKQLKGKVTELAADHLVIETTDHREINCAITKDTKFLDANTPVKLENLALGQTVWVASREGEREEYTAVSVQIVEKSSGTVVSPSPSAASSDPDDSGPPKIRRAPEKAGAAEKAEAAPPAEEPETPSTIVEKEPANTATEADDGARPVLRRGKPRETRAAATRAPSAPSQPAAAPVEVASARTTPQPEEEAAPQTSRPKSEDEFLAKAREVAEEFTQSLPNFTCREMVTRYETESAHGAEWQPIDVITTGLVYEGGKERYQDLTGKKASPEKSGAWSYGEFGSVLGGLFHLGARFTFAHDSDINGFSAKMFHLEVERTHSNWTIHEGGQTIRPGFKGSVWIDKATYRVIRLETQAVEIPKEFPLDTAEMALDYQFVSLGTQKFMVPVHAEVLACHRGTPQCEKNAIEFRNFKKFGSESEISFGQ